MQTQHRAPVLRFSDHPAIASLKREDARVTVIVVTHERPRELDCVLSQLRQLPEQPRVLVLDNASRQAGAVARIARLHGAELVRCEQHLGAAACNPVVAQVTTPHVAFCDDGTWWTQGALKRACDLMDEYPHIGVINCRVLTANGEAEHPICERMQHSTLDDTGLPGPALISFMANAVVMRTRAFRHAEGYEPEAFRGAEEVLIGLSLAALGWRIVYARDVTMHQLPTIHSHAHQDPVMEARNRLWVAWLRLPWPYAWQETQAALATAWREGNLWSVLWHSAKPLSRLVLRRRAVPDLVARMHRATCSSAGPPARAQTQAKALQRPEQHAAGRPTNMPPC